MTRVFLLAALAALWSTAAAADGAEISGAAGVNLKSGSAGFGAVRTIERGVAVTRGPKSIDLELAGAEATAERATASDATTVIVEVRLRPRRFLRTQGFYSGHPGSSRRFTQGFWSGPVDLGDRPRVVVVKR